MTTYGDKNLNGHLRVHLNLRKLQINKRPLYTLQRGKGRTNYNKTNYYGCCTLYETSPLAFFNGNTECT